MFIFCQELSLSLSSFRVGKVYLSFIQRELLSSCSHLELRTAKQTLSSSFIFHYDRFFLSKCVFFIISFLSHVVFQLRATSDRLNFFRLDIKVTFGSFGKIERRLMIPLRLFILELLKDISLNRRFLSNLCTFNKRLYQTVWLLEIGLFETNKALYCILTFSCSERIACKLGLECSWCHLLWLRHSNLRDWSLFQMFCYRVVLRSIKVSWGLVIISDYCNRSSWTYFWNRSKTWGASIQFIFLHRNFHKRRLFQTYSIDHPTWYIVSYSFLDLLNFEL